LSDKKFNELEGFKMILLADGTFGTLTLSSDSNVYIEMVIDNNINKIESNNFINQLNSDKLIDKKY